MGNMKIIVRNNDAVKAYRVLMKNLNKDFNGNYFKELRKNMHYTSKSEEKRLKHKKAVLESKREEEKRYQWFLKEEKKGIINSKKRARDFKKKQQVGKPYRKSK